MSEKKLETADDWHAMFLNENFYGKDDPLPYLIIIGVMEVGNKKGVRELLGDFVENRTSEFNEMWATGTRNRIFFRGKVVVENIDEGLTSIELILGAGVLKGLFIRGAENE